MSHLYHNENRSKWVAEELFQFTKIGILIWCSIQMIQKALRLKMVSFIRLIESILWQRNLICSFASMYVHYNESRILVENQYEIILFGFRSIWIDIATQWVWMMDPCHINERALTSLDRQWRARKNTQTLSSSFSLSFSFAIVCKQRNQNPNQNETKQNKTKVCINKTYTEFIGWEYVKSVAVLFDERSKAKMCARCFCLANADLLVLQWITIN